ncbi:MAG: F0F1 ATP synthase subunit alpha [Phycisphaeraceae bacterium]|nr:F0F1 ATP synthase subunit alpha [Phycisphaeraceae bacterium]
MAWNTATSTPITRRACWLSDYQFGLRLSEQGNVVSVGDGIVWMEGLPSAAMDEMLVLEDGSRALVFHLARQRIGGILLHQTDRLTSGTPARRTGRRVSLPTGDAVLGRVVDPIGVPLDGWPAPESTGRRDLFAASPPILARDFVQRPIYTGCKMVDALIPIGKGQRQLIIGDNGVGKSSLALDAVIHQRGRGVRCVYVLIGQKRSSIAATIQTLRAEGAMAHTTLVVAEATALPGLKYLAPFAGCAIAESWMEQGHDVLIIYDDLTTHAQTYRELSLLLRRPPGREAYPGDIFFLHARLLERSTCLAASMGGGSITSLPIVETNQGEISAYVPTNLISITDGQVYLDSHLFAAGVLPAIDVTRSVSRIGGKGQHPRVREQSGRIKLDYLQFLELEVYTRFGTHLEAGVEARIKRGRVLREILKQDRLDPRTIEFHLAWLMAFNEGRFDAFLPEQVAPGLERLAERIRDAQPTLDTPLDQWQQIVASAFAEHAPP